MLTTTLFRSQIGQSGFVDSIVVLSRFSGSRIYKSLANLGETERFSRLQLIAFALGRLDTVCDSLSLRLSRKHLSPDFGQRTTQYRCTCAQSSASHGGFSLFSYGSREPALDAAHCGIGSYARQ